MLGGRGEDGAGYWLSVLSYRLAEVESGVRGGTQCAMLNAQLVTPEERTMNFVANFVDSGHDKARDEAHDKVEARVTLESAHEGRGLAWRAAVHGTSPPAGTGPRIPPESDHTWRH